MKFFKKGLEIVFMDLTIKNANLHDVDIIYNIIKQEARRNLLLVRTKDEIAAEIRTFKLAENDNKTVGCASLYIWNRKWAEIRSLAVVQSARMTGVGGKLVKSLIHDAKLLGLKQVFALTYQVDFFRKQGFHLIEFSKIPDKKIWDYCARCPLLSCCNEKAMLRDLH